MKERWRTFFVALATTALALSACGGATTTQAPASQAPATATATPGLSGELVVWDWIYQLPQSGDALKQIDAEFIKLNPNVKITHVGQPADKIDEWTRAAGAAKAGPDVMMVYPGEQGALQYGPLGLLTDLKPQLDQATIAQFPKTALDVMAAGLDSSTSIYALPWEIQAQPWYYNKTQFQAVGLDPQAPPTNYDQLLADCQKLKDAGYACFAGGSNQVNVLGIWLFKHLWSALTTPENALGLAKGTVKWTTDPTIKTAVQQCLEVEQKGYFLKDYTSVVYMRDGETAFGNGKGAIVMGLLSNVANWSEYLPMLGEGNLGYLKPPGAQWWQIGPALGWTVTSWAKNPAAALAYVKFVTGPEAGQINWTVGGNVPINNNVDVSATAPQILTAILEDINAGPTGIDLTSIWPNGGQEEIGRQFQLLWAGTETVDDLLNNMQTYWDKNLKPL